MSYGDKKNEEKDESDKKRWEAAQAKWRVDWSTHNKALQSIEDAHQRFDYISDFVTDVNMCDKLVAHLKRLGIPAVPRKFDWTNFKKAHSNLIKKEAVA